jgi:gamma-glutamyltranspeptidase/glutathione hydrolase
MSSFTCRPLLQGNVGMVSSTHWLASAVGMRTLELGGNAFDAAAAAGFMLQVVEPHLNGVAGECPIIAYDKASDRVRVVNGQGVIPAGLTVDRLGELGHEGIPGTGPLSATVPGTVDAWMVLAQEYGRLGPRELLEPAIATAAQGVPVTPLLGAALTSMAPVFREYWTHSAEAFLGDGVPPVGGRLRNPLLSRTLQRMLDEGLAAGRGREAQLQGVRDAFYRGFVADVIDAAARDAYGSDAAGAASPCVLTGADLAAHRASFETPASLTYSGVEVCKVGPWSQGPVFLQHLALLAAYGFDAYDPQDPDCLHVVLELGKLAFADREAWYGDPLHVDVPMDDLLSAAYAAERVKLLGDTASLELRPGSPGGRTPRMAQPLPPSSAPPGGARAAFGEPTVRDSIHRRDTCYLAVCDREGNMVSATPSGGWLQSSPALPGLGFALGTRAQMAWLEQGLPNSLAPGRRPRTTLSPSLLRDGDGGLLAFGTPGGDRQDQWSLNFLLSWLHSERSLQEAVEAPNFHSTHAPMSFFPRTAEPGVVHVEGRMQEATVAELRRRGHEVVVEGDWSLGRLGAAGIDRETGWLVAASNPRGQQGYAVGR